VSANPHRSRLADASGLVPATADRRSAPISPRRPTEWASCARHAGSR
jgi:hypothetical protein